MPIECPHCGKQLIDTEGERSPEEALAFAERMLAVAQSLYLKARADMRHNPQVNPVEMDYD